MSNVLIPINFDGEQPTGSAGQQKSLVRDSCILSISSLHKKVPQEVPVPMGQQQKIISAT